MNQSKDNFEKNMKKLEEIVRDLEKGDFTLEESLEKFEEGLKLGGSCKEMLEKAEDKIRQLEERERGTLGEKDSAE